MAFGRILLAWVVVGAWLVIWAFGWAGGRELVETSYADAKVKVAEQKTQRAAAQAAKHPTRKWSVSRLRRRPP